MALVVKDRVKETTTTTGTGSVTLAGAATGFQTFNSAIGVSNTTYYCIAGQGTSEWEVGLGTLSASTTLARTTIYASSNAGSAVNFSAGTKDVFVTFPAGVALQQPKYDIYTSGTATWTAPTGVTSIKVICIGGGGGGGSAYDDGDAWHTGGTGGTGGISIGIYTVVPGTGYVATVGAGGAGATTAPNGGAAGGTSSLGALLSATGGSGGAYGNSGATGAVGAGSSGVTANSSVNYGAGGAFLGNGGRTQAVSSSAAVTWTASLNLLPGAGGGGATSQPTSDVTGGVGGVVYIEYIG